MLEGTLGLFAPILDSPFTFDSFCGTVFAVGAERLRSESLFPYQTLSLKEQVTTHSTLFVFYNYPCQKPFLEAHLPLRLLVKLMVADHSELSHHLVRRQSDRIQGLIKQKAEE